MPDDDSGRGPVSGRVALVLLAAGSGTRSGYRTNKVLLPLAGRPVLTWTLEHAAALDEIATCLVVVRAEDAELVGKALRNSPVPEARVVVGGRTRHESELRALQALRPSIENDEVDVVVMHDAARPLAARRLFEQIIDAARLYGGAIPVVRRDDLVFAAGGRPVGDLVGVQTPQAFRARPLLAAYLAADEHGFEGTDTAACVERFSRLRIRGVAGNPANLKITYPDDLQLAERLVALAGSAHSSRSRSA